MTDKQQRKAKRKLERQASNSNLPLADRLAAAAQAKTLRGSKP